MEMNALQEQKRARDLTPEDRAEIIRQLEFGSTLDDALVSDMARNSVVLDFRRRRFVYRAGEPGLPVCDYSWPNKTLPNRD